MWEGRRPLGQLESVGDTLLGVSGWIVQAGLWGHSRLSDTVTLLSVSQLP